MKTEIMMKTYEVVDEIKSTKAYQELLVLSQKINNNSNLLHLIDEHKKWQKKYEDVKKYGKYHPDLKKVSYEFSLAKETLYTDPLFVEYKKREKEVEKMLNSLSATLAQAVSEKIRYKNEIGLIKK